MALHDSFRRQSAPLIDPQSLGSTAFRADHNVRLAYVAGAMYQGIASKEMVVAMGKAGLIGFFGAGGVPVSELETVIRFIQENLANGEAYGMNFIHHLGNPKEEERVASLYLKHGVRRIEASAFMQITPSLVRYRVSGLSRRPDGAVVAPNSIIAKVSRPEVATAFMRPPPQALVSQLVQRGEITAAEADLSQHVPMAQDICVEADSGGHTDQGVAIVLLPAMIYLRDEMMRSCRYAAPIRIGAAGGIGTPEAAAAAFIMGADFILTGSINQCTVEAGTSDVAKDLLQQADVQDTGYVPAADMFELGAKVQVFKKGLFFPARANKLHELYLRHGSLDEIDAKTRSQVEEKYFRRSFEQVRAEARQYLSVIAPGQVDEIFRRPKQEMAWVFRWYFAQSTRTALAGDGAWKLDYQIQCGPALGAFNRWVKDTELRNWRERRVAELADKIMNGTAELLSQRFAKLTQRAEPHIGAVVAPRDGGGRLAGRYNDPACWREIDAFDGIVPEPIRAWLVGPRVLSREIAKRCSAFSFALLTGRPAELDQHERAMLDTDETEGYFRQVMMGDAQKPYVFGHVVMPRRTYLAHKDIIGDRPLGETFLFGAGGVQRGPFRFARLPRETSELILDACRIRSTVPGELWARQSMFWIGVSALLVREVFLPGIPAY
jgi:trans-AT polyketide synthase/acyltransferase/oxidoreductase domain-containing protein